MPTVSVGLLVGALMALYMGLSYRRFRKGAGQRPLESDELALLRGRAKGRRLSRASRVAQIELLLRENPRYAARFELVGFCLAGGLSLAALIVFLI